MSQNTQEKIRTTLKKVNLKDLLPIEKRKKIMSRLMTITLVIAWFPIFAVVYGLFYKFIFQPLKETRNADLVLITVIVVSSVGTIAVLKKAWAALQEKIFTAFEGNEKKNIS